MGTDASGVVEPAGAGEFIFSLSTADYSGPLLLSVRAVSEGGLSREMTIPLAEDRRPPFVEILSPPQDSSYSDWVSIRGRVTSFAGNEGAHRIDRLGWSIPGSREPESLTFDIDGSFTFTFPTGGLPDTFSLQIEARNRRGIRGESRLTLADDRQGPSLSLLGAREATVDAEKPFSLEGRIGLPPGMTTEEVVDRIVYRVLGTELSGALEADETGRFTLSLEPSLLGEEQILEIWAWNRRDNSSSQTVVLRRPALEAPPEEDAQRVVRAPAPIITLDNAGEPVYASRVEISGVITGFEPGSSLEWEIAGTELAGTESLSTAGRFSLLLRTEGLQGTQLLKLRSRAPGGTVGEASLVLRDDGVGPYLRLDSPPNGSAYRSQVEVLGQVANAPDDLRGIREVGDLHWEIPGTNVGGRIEVERGGAFRFAFSTVGLPETIVVKITALDKNLWATEKSLTLINDGIGPFFEISTPVEGTYYSTAPLDVEGIMGNNPDEVGNVSEVKGLYYRIAEVGEEPRPVFFQEDGTFFFSVDLSDQSGPQILELQAETYTGNRTSRALRLLDGTIPPEIRLLSPEPESPYGAGVWLTGRIIDPYGQNGDFGGIERVTCAVSPLEFQVGEDTLLEEEISLEADGSFRFGFSSVRMKGPQEIRVEAVARNGNRSIKTMNLVQGENAIPTLTAVSGDQRAFLNWDLMPGVSGYTLFYTQDNTRPSPENGEILPDVRPPLEVVDLATGRICSFLMRAETPEGTGWSGVVRTVPMAEDSLGLVAKGEFGQVRLVWETFPALSGYRVLRAREDEAVFSDISGAVLGGGYIDTMVEFGRRYLYRVVPDGFEEILGTTVSARSLSAPPVRIADKERVEGFTPLMVDVEGGYAYTAAGEGGLKSWISGIPTTSR